MCVSTQDPTQGPVASSSLLPQNPEGGTCTNNSGCTPGKAERKAQGEAVPLGSSRLPPPGSPSCPLPSCHPDFGLSHPRRSVLRLLLLGAPSLGAPRSGAWGVSSATPAWGGYPGLPPSLQASARASVWPSTTPCRPVRSSAGALWRWTTTSHGNALSFPGAGSRVPSPDRGVSGSVLWEGSVPTSSNPTHTPYVPPRPKMPQPLIEGPGSPCYNPPTPPTTQEDPMGSHSPTPQPISRGLTRDSWGEGGE